MTAYVDPKFSFLICRVSLNNLKKEITLGKQRADVNTLSDYSDRIGRMLASEISLVGPAVRSSCHPGGKISARSRFRDALVSTTANAL